MSGAQAFDVRLARWETDQIAMRSIRHAVFVVELGVPAEVEQDGRDPACRHVIADDAQRRAIGCGRLLPDGYIGRIAVLHEWRRRGVGTAILQRLVELARELGHARVALNARADACDFYARHGFARTGEPWLEAAIAHVAMERRLPTEK